MITNTCIKVLLILKLCSFIKGDIELEILQNINGNTTKLVSSLIEVTPGSNITLVCKILNPKLNFNANVTWFKLPKRKFDSLNNDIKLADSALLRLNRIRLQNEGYYSCASLKYGIFKDFYLHVKNNEGTKKLDLASFNSVQRARFKRAQVEIYNDTALNEIYRSQINEIDDMFKLHSDIKKLMDEHYRELEEQKAYTVPTFNINYDLNDHITHTYKYSKKDSNSDSPFKSIFVLVGVLLLVIFVSFLIRCYEANKHSSTSSSVLSNATSTANRQPHYTNTRSRCGHFRCNRNHLLNPSGVCRELSASSPTESNTEGGFELRTETDTQPRGLDLPPNYNSTIIDSGQSLPNNMSLPPTYEEAIAINGCSPDNAKRAGH